MARSMSPLPELLSYVSSGPYDLSQVSLPVTITVQRVANGYDVMAGDVRVGWGRARKEADDVATATARRLVSDDVKAFEAALIGERIRFA